MRVMPCQNSRVLFTALLLVLTDYVRLTKAEEQSDIHKAATKLQGTSKLLRKPSQQQEHSALSCPLVTPNQAITTQGIETQTGPLIHYLTPHFPKHSFNNPAKANIHQITGSHDHTDYTQDKHDTLVSEALSEAPVTAYFRTKRNVVRGGPHVTTIASITSTGDTSSQMSTFDNMFLCDHPPETFSPSYLGSSLETCLQYDRKFELSFTDTMIICNDIYSSTESNPDKFTYGALRYNNGLLRVIAHENYVHSCLPLFRRFNDCEERDFLTICWEDEIAFWHSNTCPRSSNDIFLASFLIENDTYCFHEFCEGRQSVVDSKVGELQYRLINTNHNPGTPSCGYMTMSLSHIYEQYNGTLYTLVNNHWPCCYPLYLVIWAGQPEVHGLNGAWSYLPPICQVGEVMLLVLVGCVMVGGVGGNLLVLVVMMSGGHRGQESSLLRTSLAFADLLTATFVVVPSFVQHLTPFFTSPHYFTVTPDMQLTTSPVNVTGTIYLTNAFQGWSGFPLFQSILFNTTSTVSLLMLLILSLERFVIAGRYLRYRDYFSHCRTVLAIIVAWMTSLANALWFAAYEGGGLAAQWLTFEKLPTGASGLGPGGVRYVLYHGQFAIFLMLGISVVMFSALAIRNYVREKLNVAAEWRSLKMKASRKYSKDTQHVLTTMALMLIFFLTSTLPLTINIIMNSVSYSFHQQTLFSYLSWWLFMAGSAWNPWIYNLRSHQFKEDIRKFHHQAKRACRQQQHLDHLSSIPT